MAVNASLKSKLLAKFEVIKPLVFPFIYLVLTVTLAISLFYSFGKRNYISIYIDGTSMQPTLNQECRTLKEDERNANEKYASYYNVTINNEYGYADKSNIAMNNIDRFNIVVTYYPGDYYDGKLKDSADFKIKRVIALPGETFKIYESVLTIKNDQGTFTWDLTDEETRPYKINRSTTVHQKDHLEYTLGDDEYWVLGDNWNVSHDSQTVGPIKKSYISGVLVAIQGTFTLATGLDKTGRTVNNFIEYKKYSKPVYYI